MYAIAFDLLTKETSKHHPKDTKQAYRDIASILKKYDFKWVQGSLYVSDNEDMAKLYDAIDELKHLSWFPHSVKDIRAFKVEQWSDFTPSVKRMIAE
ncbi:virulence factor [Kaistella sp.]|uniref:virulence factor n=1 Tax=Kaistella sp. TaxID=2782235 RepID=UPI0035A1886C